MLTWQFDEFGDIKNLTKREAAMPKPAAGEALVRVDYAALNPADYFLVQGQYPRPGTPPFAVGRDGCGTIEQPAAGGRFAAGDRVVVLRSDIGVKRDGTLAQFVAVPEESLAPLPAGWTPQEGAAGPLTHLTAWQALVDEGELKPGQHVLVTGASGGVGTASIVLAKALGATVVALSRAPEKSGTLRALGADHILDSNEPDLPAKMKQVLGGAKIDVAVENIGGDFLPTTLDCLGMFGRVGIVGILGGRTSPIDVGRILFKRVRIATISVGAYTPRQAQDAWSAIVATMDGAGQRPLVGETFAFDNVQAAFAHLQGGHMGKVLVGPMHP